MTLLTCFLLLAITGAEAEDWQPGRLPSRAPISAATSEKVAKVEKAIEAGNSGTLRALLRERDLQIDDQVLQRLLNVGIDRGNLDAVIELAKRYPKVLKRVSSFTGEGLAQAAARLGRIEVLKEAVALGAPLTGRNFEAEDILENVARAREGASQRDRGTWDRVIEYLRPRVKEDFIGRSSEKVGPQHDRVLLVYGLIEAGKGEDLLRIYGRTWLNSIASWPDRLSLFHWAVFKNDARMVGALIDLGLKPDLRDVTGYNARERARHLGLKSLTSLFSKIGVEVPYTIEGVGPVPMPEVHDLGYNPIWDAFLSRSGSYQNDSIVLQIFKVGSLEPRPNFGVDTLLGVGARRNSALLIQGAYEQGEKPFVEKPGGIFRGKCAPTAPEAIDLYLSHPSFKEIEGKPLKSETPGAGVECNLVADAFVPDCFSACSSPELAQRLLERNIAPQDLEALSRQAAPLKLPNLSEAIDRLKFRRTHEAQLGTRGLKSVTDRKERTNDSGGPSGSVSSPSGPSAASANQSP